MRSTHRVRAVIAAVLLITNMAVGAMTAAAITGSHPVVIALCNFTNQTQQPFTKSYFEHMFSDPGAGELGAFDYWDDMSYGTFSVSGTVVHDWTSLGITRDAWGAFSRGQKWASCAQTVEPVYNLNNYTDVIVVFPEAQTTIPGALAAGATTMTVASVTVGDAANFPTPPFLTSIFDGPGNNAEAVTVTGIVGTTFTIVRGQGGTSDIAHAAGSTVQVPGDLFGFGPIPATLNGNNYTLGGVVAAHDIPLSVYTHEMGHGFGFDHSRKLSTSTTDYNDCYDIMSAISCIYSFTGAGTTFGGSTFGGNSKGPGMNAVQLDLQGWIPGARETTFTNTACARTAYSMAALNHPEASGYQEVRIPSTRSIAVPAGEGGTVNATHYTVELRAKTDWDRGIPQDAFVLHLAAAGRSYWVDGAGHSGGLIAGDQYADVAGNAYVAVNSINSSTYVGVITLSACKIDTILTYNGDTSAAFGDTITLAGTLLEQVSTTPIPAATVDFTLGSQTCSGITDAVGHASCTIVVNQNPPGPGTVSATYGGGVVYYGSTDSDTFSMFYKLTGLSAVHAWIGLKNSDDQGTQFDLRAELIKNGSTVIATGLARCITGTTRNPTFAKDGVIDWDPIGTTVLNSGDVLSVRLSTRIGTTTLNAKCPGTGGSHASAVGLRVYYDGSTRQSGFDTTISTQNVDQYLHSDGTVCTTVQSAGVTTRPIDEIVPTSLSAKCKDSPVVKFAGGNLFQEVAVWTMAALP